MLLIICGSGAAAVLLRVINRKKNKWDGSRLKEPVIISLVLGGLLLFTLVLKCIKPVQTRTLKEAFSE